MKRFVFYILKCLSFCLHPLRRGYYIRILQAAYRFQGVKFKGRARFIHHSAFIDNVGDIEIGKNVIISVNAILLAHDYSSRVKNMLVNEEYKYIQFLKIGDNVFVGAGAIILPQTRIGNYCIIGAGAVVKGTIPDYSVVVGNPCKIIKSINPEKYEK